MGTHLKKWVDYDDGYTPIKGKDYKDWEDWITPIKWKDYFTKKELQEIKLSRIQSYLKCQNTLLKTN